MTAESKRLAWFAWSPGDFNAKTAHLSKAVRHAYRDLLDHAFIHGRDQTDLLDDDELLQEVVGQTADEWARTRRRLMTGPRPMLEPTGDGYLRNRRLTEEVIKAREKSDKARQSANARHHKDGAGPVAAPADVAEVSSNEELEGHSVSSGGDAVAVRSHCVSNATASYSSSVSPDLDSGSADLQKQRTVSSRARAKRAPKPSLPVPPNWEPPADKMTEYAAIYPSLDINRELFEFRVWTTEKSYTTTSPTLSFVQHLKRENDRAASRPPGKVNDGHHNLRGQRQLSEDFDAGAKHHVTAG